MSENKKAKYEQREPFDKFHKLEAFMEAAYEIIGSRSEVRCGLIEDNFGGQLFFAYLPEGGVKKTRIDREIERDFTEHPEAVARLLPPARRDFIDRIPDKISASLEDLSREVLSPLYEETGKKWKQLVIIHNDEPFSTERFFSANEDESKLSNYPRIETHELKHGIITRTRMKGSGPGRHSQWRKEELERAVKAAMDLLPVQAKKTHAGVLDVVKRYYPEKAPKSVDSFKKLLSRLGVNWMKLKRESIQG
jgi:hypothetical protein